MDIDVDVEIDSDIHVDNDVVFRFSITVSIVVFFNLEKKSLEIRYLLLKLKYIAYVHYWEE